MLDLTPNAKAEASKITVTPTIVFEIDGYSQLFTSVAISKYIRIGDPGLEIGDDWVIGGVRLIDNQSSYMSFTSGGGTTTKITQKVSPDRAQGSSISTMVISLVDKNEEISRLISPGFDLEEILGRNCTVSIGFAETSYPEDYNVVFRGIVSDIESGPGYVNFLLANSEEKKRRPLIGRGTTELTTKIWTGYYKSDVRIKKINYIKTNTPSDPTIAYLANALFFTNDDIATNFGISVGDYVDIVNSEEPANNVIGRTVLSTGITIYGSYLVISGAALSDEEPTITGKETTATVSFYSQFEQIPLATVTVQDASSFSQQVNGPNGSPDADIEYLIQIDDEVFKYDTISGNTLSITDRAVFGTVVASHEVGRDVKKGLRLQGNGIDLALKIMLSGINGYFATSVPIEMIGNIAVGSPIANAVFFDAINVIEKYGLTDGDWITVVSATNGANNFTMRQIVDIDTTEDGSYVVVDGAALISEYASPAVASFRSKYDSLGIGLKMTPAEVDVQRHEFIRDTFLSTFNFDFSEFDIPVTKDFIEKELYLPMACFSIPRSGRSSVTYTIGPLAMNFIPTLDVNNVKNANALKVKRSIASNFSNTIEYQYDYNLLESKYEKTKEFASPESKTRIPIGDKLLTVKSKGMKTSLSAASLSTLSSERMLGRYRFGAEFINGVQLLYGDGYPIEIGDVVLVDYSSLKLTDFNTGDRAGEFKYMEVINKTLDNKTGEVSLDLLNTAFEYTDRYGTISPSSKVGAASSTIKIVLEKSWGTKSYDNEIEKWEDYIGQPIVVHSADWTFQEETVIQSLGTGPDAMIVSPALSVAPSVGYIVDIPYYPSTTDPSQNATLKGLHAFFSPNIDVVTGVSQTKFTVSPTDFPRFLLGAIVRLNNFGYTDYSPEAEVIGLNSGTYEIEIDTATGFTINNTHDVKLIGFADAGYSYRYI